MVRGFDPRIPLVLICLLSSYAFPQEAGRIQGQIRVAKGDFPPHPILVELQLRSAPITSVYTDAQGRFGFYQLESNPYHVIVNDEDYYPADELANVNLAESPFAMVQIILRPREKKNAEVLTLKPEGGNPNLLDIREYSKSFPKKAVKEFEKGVASDHDNKKDDAIAHYQKALELAPDFYPAHNNLGSDELAQSRLEEARSEFEKVLQLNQSDATAYFNLANVCLLQGHLQDAQNFLNLGLRRQPDSALGKFLLGSLHIRAGKLPEAEAALQQAVQLDPTMAQPRLQLVNLYLKEGKKIDAVEQLHAFLAALPGSPFSGQAKQLLQRLEANGTAPKPASPN